MLLDVDEKDKNCGWLQKSNDLSKVASIKFHIIYSYELCHQFSQN